MNKKTDCTIVILTFVILFVQFLNAELSSANGEPPAPAWWLSDKAMPDKAPGFTKQDQYKKLVDPDFRAQAGLGLDPANDVMPIYVPYFPGPDSMIEKDSKLTVGEPSLASFSELSSKTAKRMKTHATAQKQTKKTSKRQQVDNFKKLLKLYAETSNKYTHKALTHSFGF